MFFKYLLLKLTLQIFIKQYYLPWEALSNPQPPPTLKHAQLMPIATQQVLLTQFSSLPPPTLRKRSDAASVCNTPRKQMVPLVSSSTFLPSTFQAWILSTVCHWLLDLTPKSVLSTTQQISHTSFQSLVPRSLDLQEVEIHGPFQLLAVAGPPPNTAMDQPPLLPLPVPLSPLSPLLSTENDFSVIDSLKLQN